jgi:hypothetical protein
LFEKYFRYTYYLVGQVLGVEVPPFMSISPMVLAIDIQSRDARSFDYVRYLEIVLNQGLERIKKNSDSIYFKYYSLLMHAILHEGYNRGLWEKELRIKYVDEEWECKLV